MRRYFAHEVDGYHVGVLPALLLCLSLMNQVPCTLNVRVEEGIEETLMSAPSIADSHFCAHRDFQLYWRCQQQEEGEANV